MKAPATSQKPLEVTDAEIRAISDPLYKAGIEVLLKHNLLRLVEEDKHL